MENSVIEITTGNSAVPEPEDSLELTRQTRVEAILGEDVDLVSIVVQAYNRLDKTIICVESILKYSSEFKFELVLLDNGSTDGTLEYFKEVPFERKRIYHVTKNVGSLAPFPKIEWNGRYLAFIPNDTYVTKNWLANLITCLKSDPAIGMAVPVIFNVDHLEQPKFTFTTLEEMQEKAALHNVSDPRLWHERILLEPLAGVYKREAMDAAGKIFDYGFFHSSADYDLAFRFRRAGFKTMLCKDTFVHHDHDRATSDVKAIDDRSRDLRSAQRDFQLKYQGIDGWSDGSNYEVTMLNMLDVTGFEKEEPIEILGVDVRCGAPVLEMKNKLREAGLFNTNLSAFTTDPKYWLDLKTFCAGDVVVDRPQFIEEHFSGQLFDIILVGNPINGYAEYGNFLRKVISKLKPDGHLFLKLRNSYDAVALLKTMGANLRVGKAADWPVYHTNIETFLELAEGYGLQHKHIAIENWPLENNIHEAVRGLVSTASFNTDKNETLARVLARDFVIDLAR